MSKSNMFAKMAAEQYEGNPPDVLPAEETPRTANTRSSASQKPQGEDSETTLLGVRVPSIVHRALKMRSVTDPERRSMSQIITEILLNEFHSEIETLRIKENVE